VKLSRAHGRGFVQESAGFGLLFTQQQGRSGTPPAVDKHIGLDKSDYLGWRIK